MGSDVYKLDGIFFQSYYSRTGAAGYAYKAGNRKNRLMIRAKKPLESTPLAVQRALEDSNSRPFGP